MHDEELAARGVGHHAAGHGQHAAGVAQVVLSEAVAGELALDGIAGAAHAGALGVAALDHEAGDDPVEDQAVVEVGGHQGDEVRHGVRRDFGIQLGLDDAAVFHFDGDDGIGHDVFLL